MSCRRVFFLVVFDFSSRRDAALESTEAWMDGWMGIEEKKFAVVFFLYKKNTCRYYC